MTSYTGFIVMFHLGFNLMSQQRRNKVAKLHYSEQSKSFNHVSLKRRRNVAVMVQKYILNVACSTT